MRRTGLTAAGPSTAGKDGALREMRSAMHRLLKSYVEVSREPVPDHAMNLCRSTFNGEELQAALDVLLDGQLTMGPQTAAFEAEWSAWLPTSISVMVNSGSSANLLMLSALTFPGAEQSIRPGDEVILPAVGWSTSLYPIAQTGCTPVLVDVNLQTLNLDPDRVEAAITSKTRAILAIHLLGNPCDMGRLTDIARRHNLVLLEDCCEAHGASVDNRRVGTFGTMSSFSFFYSHHMTSVEGGMICAQESGAWHDLLISYRSHGWIRGRSDRAQWISAHPEIDPRWLFVTPGYNLRPTDINAAIGRVQLSKLTGFVQRRVQVRRRLQERLRPYQDWLITQEELPGHQHSAFGLSIIVDPRAPFSRQDLQRFLELRHIETRPIVAGNLARQPAMIRVNHRIAGPLAHADLIHINGFMIGNHADITHDQEDYLLDCVEAFIARYRGRAA